MDVCNIFQAAYAVLQCCDADEKCRLTVEISNDWYAGKMNFERGATPRSLPDVGRPQKPVLALPKNLPKRSLYTAEGRIIFMHAIAHIEFNAINLAWDAVYRFPDMPEQYYSDWITVAVDEARHFCLVREYLKAHAHDYGDYPAHNGLWDMAIRTEHDVMVRMALVPRVLEARGLDVTPTMAINLRKAGDMLAADIMQTIYEEEIEHVRIGSHWFKYCCTQRSLCSVKTFETLIAQNIKGTLRGPYNNAARLLAGFDQQELDNLNALYDLL